MGDRLNLCLFRGMTDSDFLATAESIVSRIGGRIIRDVPNSQSRHVFFTCANDQTLCVSMPYLGGSEHLLCKQISESRRGVWMELRIQEGSLWDYSLFKGGDHLHNFSTLPEYWDRDPAYLRSQRGNVEELCEVWNCEKSQVVNYLRPWKMRRPWYAYLFGWINLFYTPPMVISTGHWYSRIFETYEIFPKGKAYPSDRHGYGEVWQVLDFLEAIGGSNPSEADGNRRQHEIDLPLPEAFKGL